MASWRIIIGFARIDNRISRRHHGDNIKPRNNNTQQISASANISSKQTSVSNKIDKRHHVAAQANKQQTHRSYARGGIGSRRIA